MLERFSPLLEGETSGVRQVVEAAAGNVKVTRACCDQRLSFFGRSFGSGACFAPFIEVVTQPWLQGYCPTMKCRADRPVFPLMGEATTHEELFVWSNSVLFWCLVGMHGVELSQQLFLTSSVKTRQHLFLVAHVVSTIKGCHEFDGAADVKQSIPLITRGCHRCRWRAGVYSSSRLCSAELPFTGHASDSSKVFGAPTGS